MSPLEAVFMISNLVIFAGYCAVPAPLFRIVRMPWYARVCGVGFFGLCGLTHVGMAAGYSHMPVNIWWTIAHVVQAIFTWAFIVFAGRLLALANRRRMQRRAVPASWGGETQPEGSP